MFVLLAIVGVYLVIFEYDLLQSLFVDFTNWSVKYPQKAVMFFLVFYVSFLVLMMPINQFNVALGYIWATVYKS